MKVTFLLSSTSVLRGRRASFGSWSHDENFCPFFRPDCDGWLQTGASAPPSDAHNDSAASQPEEDAACCEQRSITETVTNGSMKETVSLTVDAKTETAVFKRFAKHPSSKTPSSHEPAMVSAAVAGAGGTCSSGGLSFR